jgi:hypothetical protein
MSTTIPKIEFRMFFTRSEKFEAELSELKIKWIKLSIRSAVIDHYSLFNVQAEDALYLKIKYKPLPYTFE